MRRLPIFLLPLFRPNARQAYYLPTSVAVTGLAKTAVCFGASLSLFAALIAHKVAPQPLPTPVPSPMLRLRGGDEDKAASDGARRRGVQRPAPASDSAPKRPRRNARGSPAPFKGAVLRSSAGQRVDAANGELRSASSTQSDESGDNQAEGGGSRQKL